MVCTAFILTTKTIDKICEDFVRIRRTETEDGVVKCESLHGIAYAQTAVSVGRIWYSANQECSTHVNHLKAKRRKTNAALLRI